MKAALAYVLQREDADPAGVGFFGVSRGGSAAICVASRDPRVWGIATDGAFGTRTTMIAYIYRWAEIFVTNEWFWKLMPAWLFEFASWAGRMRTQRRLGRKFANVERAVSGLAPRPLMMIHGEKDNYIAPAIAKALYACAKDPKELWIVPKAKHNRGREVDPRGYQERVERFFRRFAPRRPSPTETSATDDQEIAMALGQPD